MTDNPLLNFRILQDLDETLLAAASATRALELWCETRQLYPAPVRIEATVKRNETVAAPDDIRELLAVGTEETVRYRRVHLTSGGPVLSRAENWYVPARLTAAMNRLLNTTTEPFGRVVSSLLISRETMESRKLSFSAASDGILQHVAVLRRGDGTPVSVVREIYTAALIPSVD
ncbi:hypothetical protein GOB93_12030 [Acetobacter musti]|uniref:Chorismate lyase n=1 Tax=Acetobacter musti TaxID=864732 RepID=A0ABX0JRE9_9PROT|nr:hypothetical protein [Acetobacter musti]NHN85363.1 hypothetical protein [Acetobacter musti]